MEIFAVSHAASRSAGVREELLVEVWGYANGSRFETRTVDIHMAKRRRKIEPNPKAPAWLITVRGEGYRLLTGS